MKKIIVLLSIILIASNLCWLFNYPDTELISVKHDGELTERDESIMYLLELLPKVSKNINKKDIFSLSKQLTNKDLILKNDCYWVNNIGFKFNEKGGLVKASHKLYNFQNGECNL